MFNLIFIKMLRQQKEEMSMKKQNMLLVSNEIIFEMRW